MIEKKLLKLIATFLVILFMINVVPIPAKAASENVIVNPGFEEGLDGLEGWKISLDGPGRGTIKTDMGKKKAGKRSLKMTVDPDAGETLQMYQANIPVKSLTEYDISLFYCIEGMVKSNNVKAIDIYWYDSANKLLNRHNSEEKFTRITLDIGASDWKQISVREKSPENAVKVSIYIHLVKGSRGTGGSLWIDEFNFKSTGTTTKPPVVDEKPVSADIRKSLVANPGFENGAEEGLEGLQGWKITFDDPSRGEIKTDTEKKKSGNRSLKMSVDSGTAEMLQLYQTNIPVKSLTEYDINLFYCMEGMIKSGNAKVIDIYWYDSNGKRLDRHNSEELYTRITLDIGATDWTQIGLRETVPENAVKASIYINITKGNRGNGGSLWIDDFYFVPVETDETKEEESVVPVAVSGSLVVNPGFEDGVDGLEGWKVSLFGPGRGEVYTDTVKKKEGNRSLRLSVDPDLGETLQMYQANIPVESLTEYDIRLFYCVEGMVGSKHFKVIDIYWYDQDGNRLDRHNSEELYTRITLDTEATDWTQISIHETSPENAAKVAIYINMTKGNRGTGGDLWMDEFYFMPTDTQVQQIEDQPVIQEELGENLVINPGFENGSEGLQGWKIYLDGPGRGVIQTDTEKVKEGNRSLYLSADPTGGGTLQIYQANIPVEPLAEYGISFFYCMEGMVVNDDPKAMEESMIDICWYDNNGNKLNRYNGEEKFIRVKLDNGATEWTYVSIREKAPKEAVTATMYIHILKGNKGDGGKLWVDEIAFNKFGVTTKQPLEAEKPKSPVKAKLTDIDHSHPFYNSILFVYEEGFMEGTSNGNFSPNLDMTKAMTFMTLYRMSGRSEGSHESAAAWVLEKGIIKSVDEYLFNPDSKITKEQLIITLYRYAIYMKYEVSTETEIDMQYNDIQDMTTEGFKAYKWALRTGITEADEEGNLNPKEYITRGEFANMIERFTNIIHKES